MSHTLIFLYDVSCQYKYFLKWSVFTTWHFVYHIESVWDHEFMSYWEGDNCYWEYKSQVSSGHTDVPQLVAH